MFDRIGPEVELPERTVSCAWPSVPVQIWVGPLPEPGSVSVVRRAFVAPFELWLISMTISPNSSNEIASIATWLVLSPVLRVWYVEVNVGMIVPKVFNVVSYRRTQTVSDATHVP